MQRIKDIKGQRFGSLVVESFNRVENRKALWNCVCDCGNRKVVTYGNLKYGNSKSCGASVHRIKHNMSNKRIYRIWKNMKNRCDSPNANHFERYGGRGITYHSEWCDFEPFYQWAKENGYRDNLTLDRIDNNGNYEPNNCRWVTQKEQANNTNRNIFVEINGEKRTLTQWSEKTGIKFKTLQNRYEYGDRGERLIRPTEVKFRNKQRKVVGGV